MGAKAAKQGRPCSCPPAPVLCVYILLFVEGGVWKEISQAIGARFKGATRAAKTGCPAWVQAGKTRPKQGGFWLAC